MYLYKKPLPVDIVLVTLALADNNVGPVDISVESLQ